jgi:hypothetical protein
LDCKIVSIDGIEVVHAMNEYNGEMHAIQTGKATLNFEIENTLQPGNYFLTIGIHRADGFTLEYLENCIPIEVLSISKDESRGHVYDFKLGYVRAKSTWQLKQ